jgi:formamidopyrimidine-DNA glycosylase
MIELPEAVVLARQLNDTVAGKKILKAIAAHTPHKFAWFLGDPQNYHSILAGNTIQNAANHGGMVEIKAGTATLVFGDGVGLRFHRPAEKRPERHQLLIEFEDSSALSATVQMYGGLWCFGEGGFDNPYYKVAREKPSPFSGQFDENYFNQLISAPDTVKLSAKACLATGQRIPGLGNGVLQDILWNAGIHPKRKVNTWSTVDRERMFRTVKTVLANMESFGGRNTEKDLYGKDGGYQTVMNKNHAGLSCPRCGEIIKKENYLGGSIYYCGGCQRLE